MGKYTFRMIDVGFLLVLASRFILGPSLSTEDFYTFRGTATALLPAGDDVYMTVASKPLGAGFLSVRSDDFSDIVKISRKDFLAKRKTFEHVARVKGHIVVAGLSHDGATLYFFQRLEPDPGKIAKEQFCGLDLKTGVVSKLSEEQYAILGSRLVDVDGEYLLLFRNERAVASFDGGRTWHKILKDTASRFPRVSVADGAVYLARDDALFVIPREAITARTFHEEKLRDLAPGMEIDSLLVSKDHAVRLSGSMGKAGDASDGGRRRLFLVSLDGSPAVPLTVLRRDKACSLTELLFARGKDSYCRISGADSPFAQEFRVLKITGDTVRESKAFSRSPTLLGALGDYLFFNVDAFGPQESYLFGIKYK